MARPINNDVRTMVESFGCELLSDYLGRHINLKLKCHCGEEWEARYDHFLEMKECSKCRNRYKTKEVFDYFNNNGFEVIFMNTEIYFNRKTLFDVIDKEGYKHRTSYTNFYNAITRNCQMERFSNRNPFVIENVNNFLKINNRPISLISNEFITAIKPLVWQCHNEKCLSEFLLGWNCVLSGRNCPYCSPFLKR